MTSTETADQTTSTGEDSLGGTQVLSRKRFERLLKADRNRLDAYIGEISASTLIQDTCANAHCRFLKLDGNKRPRTADLAKRLALELIDFAIPRSEIEEAKKILLEEGSARRFSAIHKKAARLFTDLAKSGESGELLLYALAESYLKLPQLFCKMPLKTNTRMHVHGTDGIHAGYDDVSEELAIYWGESKLYQKPADAIATCFKSLAPFVMPAAGSASAQGRDLELLRDNLDLNDSRFEKAILNYLDPDNPNYNKLKFRGLALVGFDSAAYSPGEGDISEDSIRTILCEAVKSWHDSVATNLLANSIADVHIELFCLPFPSVQEFRDCFLSEISSV